MAKAKTYNIDIDSYIGYPISKGYVRSKLQPMKGKPCSVRINSYGGDVMTALDIRQQFIDHGDVTAYIVGMTASAATILAMGAKKVVMSRYALMLVHPCSNIVDHYAYYNSDELEQIIAQLRSQQTELQTLDGVIASLYAAHAGGKAADMAALMREARWITADEALKFGLIDAIDEDDDDATTTARAMSAADREHFVACGLPLPNVEGTQAAAPAAPTPQAAEGAEATTTEAAPTGQDGAKNVGVADRIISFVRQLFSVDDRTGAPENTPAGATCENENINHNTQPNEMNKEAKTPAHLCGVLKVEALSTDAEGRVALSADQVAAIDTAIAALKADAEKLKADKAELEKQMSAADGDTTMAAMPAAEHEAEALPGADAVDFYKKFNGLI